MPDYEHRMKQRPSPRTLSNYANNEAILKRERELLLRRIQLDHLKHERERMLNQLDHDQRRIKRIRAENWVLLDTLASKQ